MSNPRKVYATNKLQKNIENVHNHDVLCGRGRLISSHIGNRCFRYLVQVKKQEYTYCRISKKTKIASALVQAIKSQEPPGRFLEQDTKTGLWNEISEKRAVEKARQALRERHPPKGKSSEKMKSKEKHTDMIDIGEIKEVEVCSSVEVQNLAYSSVGLEKFESKFNICSTHDQKEVLPNLSPIENSFVESLSSYQIAQTSGIFRNEKELLSFGKSTLPEIPMKSIQELPQLRLSEIEQVLNDFDDFDPFQEENETSKRNDYIPKINEPMKSTCVSEDVSDEEINRLIFQTFAIIGMKE